jgi:hypothetical protein
MGQAFKSDVQIVQVRTDEFDVLEASQSESIGSLPLRRSKP